MYRGEKVSVKENRMVVTGEDGEHWIPMEDLYSVVIDNQQTLLTAPFITRITEAGAHILICNEKHLPASVILPQSIHYHPLTVIRRQIALPEDVKDALWDRITKQKILNQAKVLSLCGCKKETVQRMRELAEEVREGDAGNREGIAAKMFFRALYGIEFVRFYDDARKHVERLTKHLPPKGSVRVLQVTEKQYNAMLILVGERTATEDFLTPRDFMEL